MKSHALFEFAELFPQRWPTVRLAGVPIVPALIGANPNIGLPRGLALDNPGRGLQHRRHVGRGTGACALLNLMSAVGGFQFNRLATDAVDHHPTLRAQGGKRRDQLLNACLALRGRAADCFLLACWGSDPTE